MLTQWTLTHTYMYMLPHSEGLHVYVCTCMYVQFRACLSVCRCVYLPNHGVFFISYIIAASFLGTITELLRVPQLIRYMYRTLRAKTSLQREQALKKVSRIVRMSTIE